MTRIDDVDYVGFSRQDCKAANVVQACLVSIHVYDPWMRANELVDAINHAIMSMSMSILMHLKMKTYLFLIYKLLQLQVSLHFNIG